LLVGLHWDVAYFDLGYDLDLYVYGPDGRLVARSATFAFSSDEGAWIQDPVNGIYRVVVVPRTVAGSLPYEVGVGFQVGYTVKESATFRLQAPGFPDSRDSDLVLPGRKPSTAHTLMPDLVPGKPTDFHMESAIGGHFYLTGSRGLNHQPSCYPQETLGVDDDNLTPGATGPLRCLRWSTVLDNRGRGPYELRSYQSDEKRPVYQTIYASNGTYTERRVPGAVYNLPHGRMDFAGFSDTALYTIASDGGPGRAVARMGDFGNCKADTQDPHFGRAPDLPPHYGTPGTCDTYDWSDAASRVHPGDSYVRVGISPGWRDTAPWYLPDQYIDVTRVPDGRYLIIHRLNTDGGLLEARRDNDSSAACVDIKGVDVSECPLPHRRHARR
jgi:hypothetical protein